MHTVNLKTHTLRHARWCGSCCTGNWLSGCNIHCTVLAHAGTTTVPLFPRNTGWFRYIAMLTAWNIRSRFRHPYCRMPSQTSFFLVFGVVHLQTQHIKGPGNTHPVTPERRSFYQSALALQCEEPCHPEASQSEDFLAYIITICTSLLWYPSTAIHQMCVQLLHSRCAA